MSKILITGGHGQLAYELIALAQQQKHQMMAPAREQLDITQQSGVQEIVDTFQPDVVINTAAYTKVDQAEQDIQQAYAVNCEGVKNIALVCAHNHIPLLHISTDYVFAGNQTRPYLESDTVSPINIYGKSKWQGEEAVREHCPQHIILRVSSVFGRHGQNFVKTILRLARERELLRIVADQTMCPTPAKAIANTLLRIMAMPYWGTYHYCGTEAVTWYDFTKAIIYQAKQQMVLPLKQLDPITTAEYPTAAKRPAYSVLDGSLFEKTFALQCPDWRTGLDDVITALSTP